jgi:hypothetical protein
MKMDEKKSLTGKKEDVEDAAENINDDDNKDVLMKYAGNPSMYANNPSVRGASASGFSSGTSNAGMFKSVVLSKDHGSPCAVKAQSKGKAPVWEEGEASKEDPIEEEGQYLPPSMKMVKEDGEDKVVKKSLTELRYGSQLARNHDIGKSCGICGRISKSCGDHEGGGCCEDCKKSMSATSWHNSHLS